MSILIVGSTGTLGSLAADTALEAGHDVIALVRDRLSPAAVRLRKAGARVRVGDLKDGDQLDKAVRGASSVIVTATATLSRKDGDSLEAVDGFGLQALIKACIQNGVRHVVLVSFSRGIEADTPLSRFKRAAERRLENSAIECTILLPSYFPEKFMTPLVGFDMEAGRIQIYGDGKRPIRYVATKDVAQLAAYCAMQPHGYGAIPMGGSKAYSQLEAVELAERMTNKKFKLNYMSLDQIDSAMSQAEDPLKQSYLGLYRGLAVGDTPSARWSDDFKMTPTRLDVCLEEMLGAQNS
ncbi:MAG: NmrA family NAD(P)-binding protein [Pseudomonadota bacterium]